MTMGCAHHPEADSVLVDGGLLCWACLRPVSSIAAEPCSLPTAIDSPIGGLCTACGHSALVHTGIAGGDLRVCTVCELLQLTAEMRRPQFRFYRRKQRPPGR